MGSRSRGTDHPAGADDRKMVLGVPPHVLAPVDALPAQSRGHGTDHEARQPESFEVVSSRVPVRHGGIKVTEIPLHGPMTDRLEVDECRLVFDHQDVEAVR